MSTVKTVSGLEHSKVLLPCDSRGRPSPIIGWLRRNVTILNDERHTVQANGTLLIEKLDIRDSGMYTCIAENSYGSASHSVFLDVHCKLTILSVFVDGTYLLLLDMCSRTVSIRCSEHAMGDGW